MFTGIVEETGQVLRVMEGGHSLRLICSASIVAQGTKVGDSMAVNGCCLTMVGMTGRGKEKALEFDLLRETWTRTNLQFATKGSLVNLERSLATNGRLHGHFVSGHIDGIGKVRSFQQRGADWFLEVAAPKEILRYVVFKGAIAVDGISLTVAKVDQKTFAVWIIPHTYATTALKKRRPGDSLNLEADLLAKYVEKLVSRTR